jgi:hypothetical protein
MELASVVLDDQVVPFLGRCAEVREPEPTIERRCRLEIAAGEERHRTNHAPTIELHGDV